MLNLLKVENGNHLLGSTRFSQETPDFLTLLMSHTPNDVDSIVKELEASNPMSSAPIQPSEEKKSQYSSECRRC
jgi:hypothetical protein